MGKYNFVIDSIDPRTTFGKILQQVPEGSEVLECGCATGYMTRFMKEKLNCTVDVIEYDFDAIKQAKLFARDGFCGDLADLEWCEYFDGRKYDRILFADVLEHLRERDPMIVLKYARQFLKDDGRIIVSIPNICHNDIIIRMFNDSFTYTELGLLDNTHIHFWGIGDFLAEAKEIGLEAETVDATQLATGTTEQRIPYDMMDKELLKALQKRQYGTVYQWIITLKRSV